jgi:uncharacterized membrane protein
LIGSNRKRYRATVESAAQGTPPNQAVTDNYSALDRIAIAITGKIGTMKFALIIFAWTAFWTGANVVAYFTKLIPMFDPFPAFVAYLLISNVIQICLMPLIMVAQNMQSRQQEAKAEYDQTVMRQLLEQLLEQSERG